MAAAREAGSVRIAELVTTLSYAASPDHVRKLFAGTGISLEFDRVYDRSEPAEYLVVLGRKD